MEFVCNMKISLRTVLIILTPIHVFYVIASCFRRVLVENLVFRLLDQIVPKFYQKSEEKSRIKTLVKGVSYVTPPLKIQNFIV